MTPPGPLQGRVCLVTGASSRIGTATAVGLARGGSSVLMVCRDPATGEAARAEIVADSDNPAVRVLLADQRRGLRCSQDARH